MILIQKFSSYEVAHFQIGHHLECLNFHRNLRWAPYLIFFYDIHAIQNNFCVYSALFYDNAEYTQKYIWLRKDMDIDFRNVTGRHIRFSIDIILIQKKFKL